MFSHCEMANLGFRMDCNIFVDICGTSKMFTKHRPFQPVFYVEIFQLIQENMGTSLKHIFISQHSGFEKYQFWKRQAPNNDEEPVNKIFKI